MAKRKVNLEEIGRDRIFLVSNPGNIPFAPRFLQMLGQSGTALINEKDSQRLARLVYSAHREGIVVIGCVSFSNVSLAVATAKSGGIVIALGPNVVNWCTKNTEFIPEHWVSCTNVIDLSRDSILQQMIGGH